MSNPGKAPEKSNFAQTCNRLSQFLKENATLGVGMTKKLDQARENSEISRPPTTTMDFLTSMENLTESSTQFVGFGPSNNPIDNPKNKADLRQSATAEPVTAQMTIFYAGQVLVFNDFPNDAAKEIMALANKRSSSTSSGFVYTSGMDKININNPGSSVASESKIVAMPERKTTQEHFQQEQNQANDSDLPIARRASLHRFLSKRKDRVAAKAPYQVDHHSQARPNKPEENKNNKNAWIDLESNNTWIDLESNSSGSDLQEGQSSKQLELKL